MKTIYLSKAGVMCEAIEDICIEISGEIPELPLDAMKLFYDLETESLYQGLITALPQATVDRLTLKLLERDVSLLKIRQKKK